MDTYVPFLLGVGISVFLYLVGYRQTIGVRKEKIRTANVEIEKTLIKRVVQESYKPSIQDVKRLIEAKAQDYNLRTTELHSEVQILNTVFSRIVETDFITSKKRDQILELLIPPLVQAEEKPIEEVTVEQLAAEKRRLRTRMSWSVVMALIASTLGVITSTLVIERPESNELLVPLAIAIAAGSILIIIFITVIYRFREPQEETTASNAFKSYLDFEREVSRVLKRAGVKYSLADAGQGYDFRTELRDKKILVEVKAWSRRVPLGMLRHLMAQLNDALAAEQADEAVIVTKAPVEFPPQALEGTKIRLMTLNELRNYIVHEGS